MKNTKNLIIALVGLIIVIAVIAGLSTSLKAPPIQNHKVAQKPVLATAQLLFNPQQIPAPIGSSSAETAQIEIESPDTAVSGVQIELQFDPTVISAITLTPTNDFFADSTSQVLLNIHDESAGRATFIEALKPGQTAKTGTGTIATVHFTIKKVLLNKTATIQFLPKSIVTTPNSTDSILQKTTNLTLQ